MEAPFAIAAKYLKRFPTTMPDGIVRIWQCVSFRARNLRTLCPTDTSVYDVEDDVASFAKEQVALHCLFESAG